MRAAPTLLTWAHGISGVAVVDAGKFAVAALAKREETVFRKAISKKVAQNGSLMSDND